MQNDIQKPNPRRSYLVSENFDLNSDNSININDDNYNNNNNINKYSNYNQPESDLNINTNKIDDNNDKIIKNALANNDHLSANQIQPQSKIDDDNLSKSGSTGRKSPISKRNVDGNKNQQHEMDNARETPPTTTSTFYTKYKQIVLYAFERSFKLNLMLIRNNQFLSPDLKIFKNSSSSSAAAASSKYRDDTSSINSNYDNTNETVDCFYRGVVDDDVKSFVYINLCHKGHVVSLF